MRGKVFIRTPHPVDIFFGGGPVPIQVGVGEMQLEGRRVHEGPAYVLPDDAELDPLGGGLGVELHRHVHKGALPPVGGGFADDRQQVQVAARPVKAAHGGGAVEIDAHKAAAQDFPAPLHKTI